jgi:microcystin-dependent protein
MCKILFCFTSLLVSVACYAQNVGIGTNAPTQKLEVNGNIKSNGVFLNNGGSQYDFLIKSANTGEIGYKKGHGAVALNYIICVSGAWPATSGPLVTTPLIGEVRMFAGMNAPAGWMFCQGQILPISQHTALFSLLGTAYGGDGQINFALPDLRGATVVSSGTAAIGYQWILGQRSN